MRCSMCGDDYEPGITRCADCGVELGAPVSAPAPEWRRLGLFSPAAAQLVADALEEWGADVRVKVHDDGSEVLVDGARRSELRTELATVWDELAGRGHDVEWYDAPRGGHVDRDGRLVLDADEAEAPRVLGPALATGGAVVAVAGWLVVDVPVLTLAGVAAAIVGLLLPR